MRSRHLFDVGVELLCRSGEADAGSRLSAELVCPWSVCVFSHVLPRFCLLRGTVRPDDNGSSCRCVLQLPVAD